MTDRRQSFLHCVIVLFVAAMPVAGWSHLSGVGTPYPASSSETSFSNTPHVHSPNFRPHYPTYSSPMSAYGPPHAYRCDRLCHKQQQQQHQFQQQEAPEQQNRDHPHVGNRPTPRNYNNLPSAIVNVGRAPPSSRLYLPTAGLQSNSGQSLNPPYPPGYQSPSFTKQDSSLHGIGAPLQQFHSGANRMNYYSESCSQGTLQSTASDMSQRVQLETQAADPLFFGAVPHTRGLLANQHHRLANGLNPNRLGSLRPGSDFYRYD